MNTVLWIIAAVLAVAFLAAGLMKLSMPKPKLVEAGQAWAEDLPAPAVKVIGALEVLAAIGLIVPALVDTGTILVPLAAVGIVALMIGAAVTHARRKEFPNIGVNVVLGALAAFVAVQRFGANSF